MAQVQIIMNGQVITVDEVTPGFFGQLGYQYANGGSKQTASTTTSQSSGNQTTGSIVDYLNSIGKPSDFNSRSALARQYGISNYTGTAAQNTQLLNAVRSSSQLSQSTYTPTGQNQQPTQQPTSTTSQPMPSPSQVPVANQNTGGQGRYSGYARISSRHYEVYVDGQLAGTADNGDSAEQLAKSLATNYMGAFSDQGRAQSRTAQLAQQAPQQLAPIPQGTQGSSSYQDLINSSPFLSEQLKDPAKKAQFDALPEEMKSVYLQLLNSLGKTIEAGKVINPDITITAEQSRQFLDQAKNELEPYYREQLRLAENDIVTSINNLTEDYAKTVERSEEPFRQQLEGQAESEAQAGTVYSSGRERRLNTAVTGQGQQLEDLATTLGRSVQSKGLEFEKKYGTDKVRSLNIPSINLYNPTNTGNYMQSDTRSLLTPLGGVSLGTVGAEKDVALRKRQAELEQSYRQNRTLNLTSL